MTDESYEIDDLSRAIIRQIQVEPRTANKEIADSLGVSEATIATRIRLLEERRILRVMLQRDMRSLGYGLLVLVDINVVRRPIDDVADDLMRIEETASLCVMMSNPEIILQLNARDQGHLLELIETKLAKVKGIGSFNVLTALEVVKLASGFGSMEALT